MAFEWLASLRHHIDSSSYMCREKRCSRTDAIPLPPNLRLTPQLNAEQPDHLNAHVNAHLHARLARVRVHSLEQTFAYDAEYAGLAPAHCALVAGQSPSATSAPLALSLALSERSLFALAQAISALRLGVFQGAFVDTIQTLALVLYST